MNIMFRTYLIYNRARIGGDKWPKRGGQFGVQGHIFRRRRRRKMGAFGNFWEKMGSVQFLAPQAPKILRNHGILVKNRPIL